jgi:ATP-binding cassette subfamily F protein 3
MLITGPNGIGKSTLLKSFLNGEGITIQDDVRIGYYSQDFSELNFDEKVIDSLKSVAEDVTDQEIYNAAGRFLISGEMLENKVKSLSEGQKGLLCYARFMLQKPGLLIMDEPTNHINFRHIPVIAKAVSSFKGSLILISHVPDFVEQVDPTDEIDLTRL